MIKYDPKDAVNTAPDGEYRATIDSVTPKLSKAGMAKGLTEANMHEVVLTVYTDGSSFKVWDYISYPKGTWKLEQIADALGEAASFKAKTFDVEMAAGKNVTVELITKVDDFGAKNVVRSYIEADVPKPAASADAVDSDIPF